MTAPAPSTTPPRRDPDQAERLLRRLDWQVIRRLDGLLQGDHRTLFYGSGTDFADLREYQTQDDVRYIDWNVTARLDVPYVRQYIDDRELTAWLLLDRSSSMGFGHVERTKALVMTELGGDPRRVSRPATATVSARCCTTTRSSGSSSRAADACRCCGSPATCSVRRLGAGASTDLGGLFRSGLQTHPTPLARVRALRLHQRTGMGADARGAGAPSRGGGGARLGHARGRAGRRRCRRHAGRRDRRAAARRHERPAVPTALRGSGRRTSRGAARRRSDAPASTSTTCRPTTTSCASLLRMISIRKQRGRR